MIKYPVTIKCDYCPKKVVKEKGVVNYARKRGKPLFCNLSCAAKVKRSSKGAKQSKKFDREYGAYLTGESMDSISRRLGLCRNATGRAFKRRGFKKRSPWIANEQQREVIKAMYDSGGYTQQILADAFGYTSHASIGQIVRS